MLIMCDFSKGFIKSSIGRSDMRGSPFKVINDPFGRRARVETKNLAVVPEFPT